MHNFAVEKEENNNILRWISKLLYMVWENVQEQKDKFDEKDKDL